MKRQVDCASLAADPTLGDTSKAAAAIAGALIVATSLIALVVDMGFAANARRWLAFGFAGLPARPAEFMSIFRHNLGALLAVAGLLVIAQTPCWAGETPGRSHRLVRGAGEVLLSGAVAANVAVVAASFGAYGARMIRAALPHGPLELGAYSMTLGLYMKGPGPADPRQADGRRGRSERGRTRNRRAARGLRDRMRSARILVCLLALSAGLAASFLIVPRAVRSLRTLTFPTMTLRPPHTATAASDPPLRHRRSRTRHPPPPPQRSVRRPLRRCRRAGIARSR
jgi:hypothetical protein